MFSIEHAHIILSSIGLACRGLNGYQLCGFENEKYQ